jgi:hypothetical protein
VNPKFRIQSPEVENLARSSPTRRKSLGKTETSEYLDSKRKRLDRGGVDWGLGEALNDSRAMASQTSILLDPTVGLVHPD